MDVWLLAIRMQWFCSRCGQHWRPTRHKWEVVLRAQDVQLVWYCPECFRQRNLPQAQDIRGLFAENPIDIEKWVRGNAEVGKEERYGCRMRMSPILQTRCSPYHTHSKTILVFWGGQLCGGSAEAEAQPAYGKWGRILRTSSALVLAGYIQELTKHVEDQAGRWHFIDTPALPRHLGRMRLG